MGMLEVGLWVCAAVRCKMSELVRHGAGYRLPIRELGQMPGNSWQVLAALTLGSWQSCHCPRGLGSWSWPLGRLGALAIGLGPGLPGSWCWLGGGQPPLRHNGVATSWSPSHIVLGASGPLGFFALVT